MLDLELSALEEELAKTKRILKRKNDELEQLDEQLDKTEFALSRSEKELKEQKNRYAELSHSFQQSEEHNQHLQQQWQQERAATILRDSLVGHLISAKNNHPDLSHFKQILENEFLPFTAGGAALENVADALLKLQEIEKELMMISGFPAFHSARTIAVGGGFSAGKSEFISSFFSDKALKLPSSIEPTTAIPTYVVNHQNTDNKNETQNGLVGINNQGATIDLLKIDPDLTQKLNHQFMRSFPFPLKSIMPYMFLTTRLQYEHICFVDTPGYNPTGSHTAEDMAIAEEFVANAEALIWLIGADANGTIPRTDIHFLKKVLVNNKRIFFVLNKADLRPESDIKKIVMEISDVLDREKINYAGVSAYNAIEGKELMYLRSERTMSLGQFLDSMNSSSNKKEHILRKLYEIKHNFQFSIQKAIEANQVSANLFGEISYLLNIENFKRGKHEVYDFLDGIQNQFMNEKKKQEKYLSQLNLIMSHFTEVIEKLFSKRP